MSQVIEHGVNLHSYFCEMARILKPGGLLITSADYFETAVNTKDQIAYGVPIHIFTRAEITQALEIAAQFGLTPTGPLDLRAEEKVVNWKEYGLSYTFVIFSVRKSASRGGRPPPVNVKFSKRRVYGLRGLNA